MGAPELPRWRALGREGWTSTRWLLAVGAGALVVRVAHVAVVLRDYEPVSDAHHYHTLATAVAEGKGLVHLFPFGFEHPTAFRPPLFPLLLGGLYRITGPRLGAAQALNVALGVAVVVAAAVLASRLAGRVAGVTAGVLVAVFPPLVSNDGPPLSEPLGLLLLLVTLLFLLDGRMVPAGVTTGLFVLTRPGAQFFALALAVWAVWRLGWRRAGVLVVCAVVVATPWLVRNWVRMGAPVLVTSNGFNLAAAYSEPARQAEGFVDPVFDPRFDRLKEGVTNEATLDAKLARLAVRSLRRDPLQVVGVTSRNARYLFELDPGYNEAPEKIDGRSLSLRRWSLPLVYLVMASGLVGLWRLRRKRAAEPLLVATCVFLLSTLTTVAAPRLRAPFDLACCVAIGVLAADLAARRRAAATREDAPTPL